jgi:hypothetical protein
MKDDSILDARHHFLGCVCGYVCVLLCSTLTAVIVYFFRLLHDSYRRELGVSSLEFYHPGVSKEQYQIAVPTSAVKHVPERWRYLSAVKTHKRYWSPEVEALQEPRAMALETRGQLLRGSLTTFLIKFDDTLDLWASATRCLSELDCLLSLATAKDVMGEPMCRPTFVPSSGGPAELTVRQLRHPCLEHTGAVCCIARAFPRVAPRACTHTHTHTHTHVTYRWGTSSRMTLWLGAQHPQPSC